MLTSGRASSAGPECFTSAMTPTTVRHSSFPLSRSRRPERILPGPVAAREGLVDDGDRLRARAIRGREHAAGLQPRAQGGEVVAGDAAHAGERNVVRRRRRVAVDGEAVLQVLAAQRQVRRGARLQRRREWRRGVRRRDPLRRSCSSRQDSAAATARPRRSTGRQRSNP